MKNIVRIIIALTIVLAIFTATALSETYFVTGDGVRVRSQPKNADNVIGKLYYGDEVDVVASKGGWSKIKFKDSYAYITDSFLSKKEVKKEAKSVGMTKNAVMLKKTASKAGKDITKIPVNTVIKVFATKSGWAAVEYNGNSGFVPTSSISIKETGKQKYIGSYTITFHQNDPTRTQNIAKAVRNLNGYTVKAGGKFSFVKAVGTKFVDATEFYEDDVSYGGGLSHVATTLNKAINDAQHNGCNIAVKEKHRFSKKTPYAKIGEEAMISFEHRYDFTFKNNNTYAIKIYAAVRGDSVIVMIFR